MPVSSPAPNTAVPAIVSRRRMEIGRTMGAGISAVGLSLDASTGVISGIPTAIGTFTFTITGTGDLSQATREYTITVAAADATPAASETLAEGGVTIPPVFPIGALTLLLLGATLVVASRRRERTPLSPIP